MAAAPKLLTQDLPWLPRGMELRARLAALPTAPLDALVALQALARMGWSESELRQLGRKVRATLQAAPGDLATQAKLKGLLPLKLLILSAHTASHMADVFVATAIRYGFLLDLKIAEYEEPEFWLQRNHAELDAWKPDFMLLAADHRGTGLQGVLGNEAQSAEIADRAVTNLLRIADNAAALTGRPVIVQTLPGQAEQSQVNMDLGLPGSSRHMRQAFNRALAAQARRKSHLLLDIDGLSALVGQGAWAAGRYWFAAKYPFAAAMAPLYCDHVLRIIASQMGRARRVLVLDLDNTLWGGIVGDDGVENLVLGSGTPLGEAHAALQQMALDYKARGILLCVSSKNDEAIALGAIRAHAEMLIREDDIVAHRINWDDKASNIAALATLLDLGLESFVFIDDNPAERKRVREALPQVAVPELPEDPGEWVAVIQAAGYFEQPGFSAEDAQRSDFYRANVSRTAQLERIGNYDDYLLSLDMTLEVAAFDAAGRKRIAQLISKSNQFNLTTRRYSETQVAAFESAPGAVTVQARLKDVFGDNGMICAVVAVPKDGALEIDTWVMSCRVLGRRVEEAILQHLIAKARASGAAAIVGRYIPTAKNGLVKDHYEKLGFTKTSDGPDGETVWRLDLAGHVGPTLPVAVAEMIGA